MATNTVKWIASTKLITTADEHGTEQRVTQSLAHPGTVDQALRELRLAAYSIGVVPPLGELVAIEIKFVSK